MRFLRTQLGPTLSLSLLTLVACNGGQKAAPSAAESASAPPAASSVAATPSASSRADQRRHGREPAGPAGTLFRATRELTLTDAQKATIDDLETQLEAADPPRDDYKDLQTDVVAGIRAGKLDAAKLQADFAAVDKAMAAHQAKEADALSSLYAALDPTQRKSMVASVRTKEAARDAQFAARPDVDAGALDWQKRRLDRLTAQLGLDAAQQKSVAPILAKGDSMGPTQMRAQREEGRKRMEAVLSAFESDHFDAKKLDLGGIPGKTAHEGLEKDTTFLSQLLPVLTQEQRDKLAMQRERGGGMHHRPEMDHGGMSGFGGMPAE